ncbi:MAG: hypothetical protein O3C27_09015 [Actinomycetota bacterium]|nr:hypothetical protein [Actinomycetota bacterium]
MQERASSTQDGQAPVPMPLDGPVIDLRDPGVTDGLAAALGKVAQSIDQVAHFSARAGAAEARAEIALHDRMAATGQVRRLNADLECEQAARHRLEVDYTAMQREVELRSEQVRRLQADLDLVRDDYRRLAQVAETEIRRLRGDLATARQAVHYLEALVGRRHRRRYQALTTSEEATREPLPGR